MSHPSSLRLAGIRVYPLKGARGCDLPETSFDALGIPGDRRWMLVRPDGLFLSQRNHPRLALVGVSSSVSGTGGMAYSVEIPGVGSFPLRAPDVPTWREVQVHRDRFRALGGYPDLDQGFSSFLGEECRLVYQPETELRPVNPKWATGHRVSLADAFPLLITTGASLEALNRKLKTPISMLRFRPNLVITGGEAWEEDSWRVLRIREVHLTLVKPCARCAVVLVDPGTGTRGKEPLRTLKRFREWEGKAFFGQNAVVAGTGGIRVGDSVHILEKGAPMPPFSPGRAP